MQRTEELLFFIFTAIAKKSVLVILLSVSFFHSQAQENHLWHDKKCAVVLTYDDALNVHLDNVIPLLDSLGFKGTFYLPGIFPGFSERINGWRAAANNGHELGNHTLFHPCKGKAPGREWVSPDYDLNIYTVQRMADEIRAANIMLEAVDGRTKRTFAYPCGDIKAGDSSYITTVKRLFPGARGVEGKMHKLNDIDLYDIGSYIINGQSGDELVALVKQTMENNSLLVFLFHGVGGEHSLNVSLDDHHTLLKYLKINEKDLWVAPLVDVAEYIKANQKN